MGRPPTLTTDHLPRPVALRIRPAAERALRSGHPWLFEGAVTRESRPGEAGDVAVIFDRKNRFLAAGLYDPAGPIRVRVLAHGSPAPLDESFFRERIRKAAEARSQVASSHTTGYRLIHGEGDGFSGLVADRYGDALVVKLYSPAWIPRLRELVPPLLEEIGGGPIFILVSRKVAADPRTPEPLRTGVQLAEGAPWREDGGVALPFLENGLRFEAHPLTGQKTGFYLDQRENRARLEARTRGARVLNLFSYTGGFSLYAARGGAGEVTSVDQAQEALNQADRHFALNRDDPGVAEAHHTLLQGDAYTILDDLRRKGERFDVVVVDPPSFAKDSSQQASALGSYARLTRLALPLLPPGGLLVQASCSSRVTAEDFFAGVHRAAREEGRPLDEVERSGHPADHPAPFPEGAYLKCLWGRVQ